MCELEIDGVEEGYYNYNLLSTNDKILKAISAKMLKYRYVIALRLLSLLKIPSSATAPIPITQTE